MEHMLASKITEWCMKKNEISEDQAVAVTYGIELLFDSLFKMIALVVIGVVFKRADQVILSIFCFSLLRSCAGGVHMKSSLGCFLCMLMVFVLSSIGAEFIKSLPVSVMIIISIIILFVNKLYAPFFTENNPIEDEKIIKRKNKGAILISMALLGIMWIVPVWKIKLLILIPMTIETLSILPLWHKGEKNNDN